MDARTQAWIDQEAARITATVRRFGWSIVYVGGETCARPGCRCEPGEGPPFAYTVGLFGMNHPELLIFGVAPELALAVLDDLARRVQAGAALIPGMMLEFDHWPRRVVPEAVPNPGEIVLKANEFYRRPAAASVPVLQLSYDDGDGRFPWEEGCRSREGQPRPGTFPS